MALLNIAQLGGSKEPASPDAGPGVTLRLRQGRGEIGREWLRPHVGLRYDGRPFPPFRSETTPSGRALSSQAKQLEAVTADGKTQDQVARRLTALRPTLTRLFMRAVRNRADADDMVQEVSLRIVRRGELDTYEGFTSYVLHTADSVLKDRNRRQTVRQLDRHVPFEAEVHSGDVPGLDRELSARDELRTASIILAQMPEMTRAVFVLRRVDGMSFAEIATRLGMSLSSAEKHMLKATRHLLAKMRDFS